MVVTGLMEMEIPILISMLMITSEEAKLTVSTVYIGRFSKSGISIYNSKIPDTAGRKTRKGRILAITKCYTFSTNAVCAVIT